jgi:hypothetical protein
VYQVRFSSNHIELGQEEAPQKGSQSSNLVQTRRCQVQKPLEVSKKLYRIKVDEI